MRKPRLPLVEQVYNLKDHRHHVIQVIVEGSFKYSESLFGKYEEGCRGSAWIITHKGIGIRVNDAVFNGG